MRTEFLSATGPDAARNIARAADILLAGGLVAFPTETVYGLGANALNPAAVERIFAAKRRPHWDPLIVHIADSAMLATVAVHVPPVAHKLAEKFWPGPLTLLFPRSAAISDSVTAGRDTVGVRMPRHPVAHALIAGAGVPVAAPSANRFGHVSPSTAAHVLADLDGEIDAVLDAGPTEHGIESTVLDITCMPPRLYRPGIISRGQIESLIGSIELASPLAFAQPSQSSGLQSPGLTDRHYAPRIPLRLAADERELAALAAESIRAHRHPAVLLPRNWQLASAAIHSQVFAWGSWGDWPALAHTLYALLRAAEESGASEILCPLPPDSATTAALRDRLLKAAAR
jgi:L-threonylcarbamoyladenylate synthase